MIIIPGNPIPQARMRHFTLKGITRLYDPNAKDKQNIRKHLMKNYQNVKCLRYPRLSFIFHMPIPKNVPKKQEHLYKLGILRHSKKPDVDNLLKLYLDCLTGMVLDDDNNVSLGFVDKLYHPEPKTIILLEEQTPFFNVQQVIPQNLIALEALLPLQVAYDHLDKSFLYFDNCKRL